MPLTVYLVTVHPRHEPRMPWETHEPVDPMAVACEAFLALWSDGTLARELGE